MFCDDAIIANKKPIGHGTLGCISGRCPINKILTTIDGPCVSYSIQNDWSALEQSKIVNIPLNSKFEAAFQGLRFFSDMVSIVVLF